MLHARPAMPNGRLRLYRWRVAEGKVAEGKKEHRALVIESEWLERTVDSLSELTHRLHEARNAAVSPPRVPEAD